MLSSPYDSSREGQKPPAAVQRNADGFFTVQAPSQRRTPVPDASPPARSGSLAQKLPSSLSSTSLDSLRTDSSRPLQSSRSDASLRARNSPAHPKLPSPRDESRQIQHATSLRPAQSYTQPRPIAKPLDLHSQKRRTEVNNASNDSLDYDTLMQYLDEDIAPKQEERKAERRDVVRRVERDNSSRERQDKAARTAPLQKEQKYSFTLELIKHSDLKKKDNTDFFDSLTSEIESLSTTEKSNHYLAKEDSQRRQNPSIKESSRSESSTRLYNPPERRTEQSYPLMNAIDVPKEDARYDRHRISEKHRKMSLGKEDTILNDLNVLFPRTKQPLEKLNTMRDEAIQSPTFNQPKLSARSPPQLKSSVPTNDGPIDTSIIVPDYVRALIRTMRSDSRQIKLSDFLNEDGYIHWNAFVDKEFPEIIPILLESTFITPPKQKECLKVALIFKVCSASGLLSKEGKPREAYATVDFGAQEHNKPGNEVFQTETAVSNNPVWNQSMTFQVKNLTDAIVVSVSDKRKDEFLGMTKWVVGDLINAAARGGSVKKSGELVSREGKRDKFVGGSLQIEASLGDKKTNASDDPFEHIQSKLLKCKVNYKSLYEVLLKNCLSLDMNVNDDITDKTSELLSRESRTLLRVFSRQWAISEAFQVISMLDLLFTRYQLDEIPTNAVLSALECVHGMKRKSGWLTDSEKPLLIDLLDKMYEHYSKQISKYRDFFPKNCPRDALGKTIFMLRMVSKNPVFKASHPKLPQSFSTELLRIATDACILRYETLNEFNAPLDESSIDDVSDSLTRLTLALVADLEMDSRYFLDSFSREFDILHTNASVYVQRLEETVDGYVEMIHDPEAVEFAGSVFELFRTLRRFDVAYNTSALSTATKFDADKWFTPFFNNWLDALQVKASQWVSQSLAADNFDSILSPTQDTSEDLSNHSSSIKDLFQTIHTELSTLTSLDLKSPPLRADLYEKFACMVYKAIQMYCDAIGAAELKHAPQESAWMPTLTLKATPEHDLNAESCVKLCNMQFAVGAMNELYKTMNVDSMIRTQRDHRATLVIPKRGQKESSNTNLNGPISGIFKIHLSFAENIKGCNKNGQSNPYVVLRVPEGTHVLQPSSDHHPNAERRVLSGKECEIARSHVVYDNLYPAWEELFECILPPITQLEVAIYSKNLISADELLGIAAIDLSAGTRLRKKLMDHQTYDIYIELEPQGKVLLRVTLEGERENIDFWFRKTRETLGRMRDDIGRSLITKISPFTKEFIQKAVKDNESVPVRSFFGAITGAVQYTNLTATSIPIDQDYTEPQVDQLIDPLTDFLHKNLSILFSNLSQILSHEVIRKKWDEVMLTLELILVPQIYSSIEKDRRVLNRRQISLIKHTLKLLMEFFHAKGNGLAIRVMQTRKYGDVSGLIGVYTQSIAILKSEYESSLRDGREKGLVLRLVRLKYERNEELAPEERDEGKRWIEGQLAALKEKRNPRN